MGAGMLRAVLEGNGSGFMQYMDRSKSVTVANFGETIDWQESEMKTIFDQFTDVNLAEEIALWGSTQTRSAYVLNVLKMMVGYKMQLFLYIKASGNESIGTPNVWAGMDAPAPVK